MFDIAFSELVIVAIVALIVIGPEKLPKVARTLGALTGRMQRYMTQIKDEVNRESRFAELQQLQQEVQEAVSGAQTSLESQVNNLTHDIADVSRETAPQVQDASVGTVESLPDQNQSKQKS
ncbi:MAG: Sec-independent protein translocase protein TatB [Methylotenera sp.]|nr:Sec-independent protein translocase protein TatB [Methylotenera sp.]